MRVHIIQPTHFSIPFQKRLFKTDKRDLIPLTLPYLAALIPEGIETRITDEQVQDWDPEAPCDCVFISVHILNSFRAYEIADAYRQKGIPVVMGGPHSTFYGNEVLEHLPEKDGPPGRFPDQLRRRIACITPTLLKSLDYYIRPYRKEERQRAP